MKAMLCRMLGKDKCFMGYLTLFYTGGFTCERFHTDFPFAFKHRYGNLIILYCRVIFQMGEGYASIQRGRGLPHACSGGWGLSDDS
jgi:hypothetical protein